MLTARDWFFFCYNFTLRTAAGRLRAWCRDDIRCMTCMSNHWQADPDLPGPPPPAVRPRPRPARPRSCRRRSSCGASCLS
ncbi:MAG: hypothetical protein MZW92_14765 [Comamonadaceae bacterium]|nr:hypothetical protein [Comamonadaceae bacterium]